MMNIEEQETIKLSEKYEDFGKVILKNQCETYFARKKGRMHVDNGTVCQDYCLAENIGDDVQVICVADGHGGNVYTKSDKGSFYACTVFVDLVKELKEGNSLWIEEFRKDEFKTNFIKKWKQTILADYKDNNEDVNEKENEQSIIRKYGTTFLFTIVTPDYYVIGQLGDGAIVMANKDGQYQLFKRHATKISSVTSSMVSNNAEYAFVVDIYERKYFSDILISTDGIYDKLDKGNSFYLYEQDLIKQISEKGEIINPFSIEDIDISNISRDDCTIALMRQHNSVEKIMKEEFYNLGYDNVVFERYSSGVTVLKGEKNEKKYEIHIVKHIDDELKCEIRSLKRLKAEEVIKLNDDIVAFIYEIPMEWQRVAKLIDSGEHLEKKYWFNNDEDEEEEEGSFSNEFWLNFYERLQDLKEELQIINISSCFNVEECMFITKEMELVITSDVFFKKDISDIVSIEKLIARFNIIGKLTCGRISIPLYSTTTKSQSIGMLHVLPEKKELCRVIYNAEKKILGLCNTTDITWDYESEKRKTIPEKSVIRLNKKQVFYVKTDDDSSNNKDAEFIDGYAKYIFVKF